ncbi:MAG: DoxX family protein [Chloroflexota bacterium]|jgi:uncharacterized membrane protein YphA (DoxX/SURF4 family)
MNVVLWVLQIILGLYFISVGVIHFIVPPGLPAPMQWMYDLTPILNYLSGTAEILGGLGLILPGVTRIQTRLVPLAALGLILVMLGAAIFHITRGEFTNIVQNIFLAALLAIVAYGRWRWRPIPERA